MLEVSVNCTNITLWTSTSISICSFIPKPFHDTYQEDRFTRDTAEQQVTLVLVLWSQKRKKPKSSSTALDTSRDANGLPHCFTLELTLPAWLDKIMFMFFPRECPVSLINPNDNLFVLLVGQRCSGFISVRKTASKADFYFFFVALHGPRAKQMVLLSCVLLSLFSVFA